MMDKAPWRFSVYTAYITERSVNVFDWPGNSADLTPPIEEVWNIMKRNLLSFQTIRKKSFEITFATYGMVFIEKLKKLYDEMPSMVEAVRKAKMCLPCTELKMMA